MKQDKQHRPCMSPWFSLAVLVTLTGCGAPQEVPVEEPAASVENVEEYASTEVDDRVAYVYYRGIHALTIYPNAGPIRSEGENTVPPFGGRSRHFTIVSLYLEAEPTFGPLIARAESFDQLLELLEAGEETTLSVETRDAY